VPITRQVRARGRERHSFTLLCACAGSECPARTIGWGRSHDRCRCGVEQVIWCSGKKQWRAPGKDWASYIPHVEPEAEP
jgi:hypothetical protein